MDYSILSKKEVVPEASSMIETFRAIGYNLETAVADIIDNSISAGSRNIYIDRIWAGGKTTITIKDDGHGMMSDEIVEAMRPGTHNPLDSRSSNDLGRFGLGMKTASFSQCRKLTVISKKEGYHSSYWTWDLDYVAMMHKWELIKWAPDAYIKSLDGQTSGTMIVWTDLDRVIAPSTSVNDINAKRKFSDTWARVKSHVSMTFHRFIEANEVSIYWGTNIIEPWNPFCLTEKKIQSFPTEYLYFGKQKAEVKGFILPHRNNFSSEENYKKAEGIRGFPASQGFYVYRGNRLLLAGSWLNLFRKEDHYKLVRISIDLPNTLDSDWQIDIKKSTATPPLSCREQLRSYALNVRNQGMEVYRHRGKILKKKAGVSFQPLWLEKKKDNRWSFVINRDNKLIMDLQEEAKSNPTNAINKLLRIIEESIPTPTIFIKQSSEENLQKEPFSDIDVGMIKEMLRRMYDNLLASGQTSEQARAVLKTIEPFNNYEELIDNL
ncbi:MAG: ATP-binding protein [Bacteroidales bacterium]|nr:ATP-binding protein [Bacteroidales bacterium]